MGNLHFRMQSFEVNFGRVSFLLLNPPEVAGSMETTSELQLLKGNPIDSCLAFQLWEVQQKCSVDKKYFWVFCLHV